MKIDFSLSDDQGPVSQKPGKLFGLGKPQQNLQLYDYKAVLYTEIHFIQEVSSAYTSPLLATDGLKVTLRARRVSKAFEKRPPKCGFFYRKIIVFPLQSLGSM